MQYYKVTDECDIDYLYDLGYSVHEVRVIATREYRAPEHGEWFIAGNIAYRANLDFNEAHYEIGELVLVETTCKVLRTIE